MPTPYRCRISLCGLAALCLVPASGCALPWSPATETTADHDAYQRVAAMSTAQLAQEGPGQPSQGHAVASRSSIQPVSTAYLSGASPLGDDFLPGASVATVAGFGTRETLAPRGDRPSKSGGAGQDCTC